MRLMYRSAWAASEDAAYVRTTELRRLLRHKSKEAARVVHEDPVDRRLLDPGLAQLRHKHRQDLRVAGASILLSLPLRCPVGGQQDMVLVSGLEERQNHLHVILRP